MIRRRGCDAKYGTPTSVNSRLVQRVTLSRLWSKDSWYASGQSRDLGLLVLETDEKSLVAIVDPRRT